MVKVIVYLIIGTVGLLFGAVQPWIMVLYAGLMILAFGVMMWQGGLSWRPGPWASGIVGFFLLVTLVQMMPLSQGVLEWVSPVRARVLEEAGELLGPGSSIPGFGYAVAYSVYQGFARWGFIICLGLFFWVCVSLGRDRRGFKRMVWVALGVGVFESIYGLIQVLIPGVGVWWVPANFAYEGCATGTYICRNHFAGLLGMFWPLALGLTLAQGEWGGKKGLKAVLSEEQLGHQVVGFLVVTLMLVALLFSQSRGGILGILVGMAVFAGLLRSVSGRFRWGVGIVLVLLISLVAVYGGRIGFDQIVERFMQIEGGAGGRMALWSQSWDMVKDHPAGIGLGNYQMLEPVYVDPGRDGIRYFHAHNDYLQLLVETGWIGAVTLVAGLFFFLARAMRRIRKVRFDVGRFRLLVSVGALAGICSMAFHGFFDFNFQIPANQVYFVLLMALVESGLWPGFAHGT
ncbi:O-antigen polymerase [delta proteobacterium NaphS2]|nr:O-antigen polymerase [delta proteobacterium NaphS2]